MRRAFPAAASSLRVDQDGSEGLLELVYQRRAQLAEQTHARQVDQLLTLQAQFALATPLRRQLLERRKTALTPAASPAFRLLAGPGRHRHADARARQRVRDA
jgi:hypothetical protein